MPPERSLGQLRKQGPNRTDKSLCKNHKVLEKFAQEESTRRAGNENGLGTEIGEHQYGKRHKSGSHFSSQASLLGLHSVSSFISICIVANQDKILAARASAVCFPAKVFGDLSPVAVAGRMPENIMSEILQGRWEGSACCECYSVPEAAGRAELLGALIGRIVKRNFSHNFGLTTGEWEQQNTLSRSTGLSDQMRVWMRALCVSVCLCAHSLGHTWSSFVTHTHTKTQSFIYNLIPCAICFYFAV